MLSETDIKQQVREFYDHVGWQEQSDGFYQNASYEDLRPVSQDYIHKCHLRVLRHINPSGHLLLDAGSGPIQYPEYLAYSKGYQFRVCADISIVALQEARKRVGTHGLFVVADIANLPFKGDVFDGEVSLHTIHHLPPEQHVRAYQELHRTLSRLGKGVIVNAWDHPPLTVMMNFCTGTFERLYAFLHPKLNSTQQSPSSSSSMEKIQNRGTYVLKQTPAWLRMNIAPLMPVEIWCWRSVNVRFLRTLIHPHLAGRFLLGVIYWFEERFPHFFGKYGQYPLIVMGKLP